MLYAGTDCKRKGKWRVKLFFTLCVASGHIVYCSNENKTTYFIKSNRGKVYAINILPVTFY
jgi:hypothetical protein